ncbi:MAG: hypothetical protein SF051_03860 [Elusimicrobiota bacterium]|nr:hypothetical protein [Elusimicrobiota bacterium]
MNILSLSAALLLAAAPAAAGVSESLWSGAASFEAAVEAAQPAPAVDAFAGVEACSILDIKTIRAISLDEASEMAAPCVAATLAKYRASGELKTGFLSADADASDRAGLLIRTDLPVGSQGLRDLAAALERREGRLLGHRVRVLRQGEAEPASVSSIQAALQSCMMPTVVRDLRTGDDFVRIYGRCLTRNPDLKINEVRGGEGLSIIIQSEADRDALRAYNGFITVNAGRGPVTLMVQAYGMRVALP